MIKQLRRFTKNQRKMAEPGWKGNDMEDLTAKALNSMVDKIIKDHQSEIKEALFSGGTEEMSKEEIFALMTVNCLSLSMKLSVQVTLDLLQSAGNLRTDEREIAKLYLKHLSSEKEE